jgi:hypothetical protein
MVSVVAFFPDPGPGEYTFSVTATAGVNQQSVETRLLVRLGVMAGIAGNTPVHAGD